MPSFFEIDFLSQLRRLHGHRRRGYEWARCHHPHRSRIERGNLMQNSQQAIATSPAKYEEQKTNLSLENSSHPGRPGPEELVPSRYALKVGEIDVMVVSDGVLSLPSSMLGHNADPAVRAAWLKDMFQPPDAFDW